jgi:uncharacterized protein (DUF4415 family)
MSSYTHDPFSWDERERQANLRKHGYMKRKTTSRASQTDWKRVSALKDRDIVIDRDAPLVTPEMFARGVLRKGLKPVLKSRKPLFSFRIDADVLEWFRAQGPGYQSRMNALLRAYMEAHK